MVGLEVNTREKLSICCCIVSRMQGQIMTKRKLTDPFHAIAQAVSCWQPVFDLGSGQVGFVVDKVAPIAPQSPSPII